MKTLKVFLYLVFIVGILGAVGYYGFGLGQPLYAEEKMAANIMREIENKNVELSLDYLYLPEVPEDYIFGYGAMNEDLGDGTKIATPAYISFALRPRGRRYAEVSVKYSTSPFYSEGYHPDTKITDFEKNGVKFRFVEGAWDTLYVFADYYFVLQTDTSNKLTKYDLVDFYFDLKRYNLN